MKPDQSYETGAEHASSALADPDRSTASLTALMHTGLDVPSPFMKDIFLVRQSIVGIRYLGGSDELVDDLKPGSRVIFILEPENRFDADAVMALDSRGRKIGYIPRHENSIIGALLKAGKSIYGIMPDKQPHVETVNKHTPYSLWVDLYMREFALPGEMTQIPRHGAQGSFAVIAAELAENEEDNEYMPRIVSGICAVKVINGEERDCFIGHLRDNTVEEQRRLIQQFHLFSGYLPLVGHDIEKRIIPLLSESYGVLLGIPFSNQVIDTKVMARNHRPGSQRYQLDTLAKRLGIEVHSDSELESRCRKTWKLYCMMERSEL